MAKKKKVKKNIDNQTKDKKNININRILFSIITNRYFINFIFIFALVFSFVIVFYPEKSGIIGLNIFSLLYDTFSYSLIAIPFIFLLSIFLYNFLDKSAFLSFFVSSLWFLVLSLLITATTTKSGYLFYIYRLFSNYIGNIATFSLFFLMFIFLDFYIVNLSFNDLKDGLYSLIQKIKLLFLNLKVNKVATEEDSQVKKDIDLKVPELDEKEEHKEDFISSQPVINKEDSELQESKEYENEKNIIKDSEKQVKKIEDGKNEVEKSTLQESKDKEDFSEIIENEDDLSLNKIQQLQSNEEVFKDKKSQFIYKLPETYVLYKALDIDLKKEKQEKPTDYSQLLEKTLLDFGVKAKVVNILQGPTVTRYELQPAKGVKVSRIVQLSDDIALSLAALSIRIEAPIPGKSVVGIEVPNNKTSTVLLADILSSNEFKKAKSPLSIAIGKDITGNVIIADLVKMPHLLIAGATGSGKTVCINSLITSLLFKAYPTQVQFVMIDPKRVELTLYNGIPHLIEPVITDSKLAAKALIDLTKLMDERYTIFEKARVRNVAEFNKMHKDEALPYIVIIIDELADLMMAASSSVETSIARLAQLARAAGIHLIVATQRPSVNVITGLIKANIPSRIAFAVSSQIDSRTILDHAGAEKLLGRGDMLFSPVGVSKAIRVQGALVTLSEIEAVVEFWSSQKVPDNLSKIKHSKETDDIEQNLQLISDNNQEETNDDEVYKKAKELVITTKRASVTYLQRKLKIGFARAGRIMDMLERDGIVSPAQGSKARKVLVDKF